MRLMAVTAGAAFLLGASAACLAWTVPVNLSRTNDVSNTFVAVDGAGRIHVAYTRSSGLYAVIIENEVRSAETALGPAAGPAITADLLGRAHVVYSEGWEIRYRRWINGSWDPTVYTVSNGTGDCLRPDVCVDSANNVHVVWTKGSNVWYNRQSAATGKWDGPQQITFTNDLQGYFPPRLACVGTAPVFIWGRTINGQWIAHFTSKETGSWVTTDISGGQSGSAGDIDVTEDGRIICTWDGDYDIWRRIRTAGAWGPLTQVRGGTASSLSPRVSCASSTKADIIWRDNGDVYGSRWNGSAWSDPGSITSFSSTGAVTPDIAHDSSGYQYVVYGNQWNAWFLTDNMTDTTAPPAPSNLSKVETDRQIQLSWTNPSAIDLTRVRVVYRLDRYPTGSLDGTIALDKPASFGSDSFTHTGLTNGVAYYYSIFVQDDAGHWSQPGNITAAPFGPPKPNLLAGGPISSFTGGVASGWTGYRVNDPAGAIAFSGDSGHYISSPSQALSGIDSASLPASGYSAAGLYQVVSGVTPGKVYQFIGYQDISNSTGSAAGHRYLHNFGINPTGGTSPGSPTTSGTIGGCKWMTVDQALWNDTPGPAGSVVYGGFHRAAAAFPAVGSSISVWTGLTINNAAARDASTTKYHMDHYYLFEWDFPVNPSLVNGDFEGNKLDLQDGGDTIPSGWVPAGGVIGQDQYAHWQCDSYSARSGANGAKLWNRRGTVNMGLMQKIACASGFPYRFSAWAQASGQDGTTASIGIDPYGGGDITSPNIIWQNSISNSWTPLSVTATSQAQAVTVFIKTSCTNAAAGGYHWSHFDDCTFSGPPVGKSIVEVKALADGTPVTLENVVVTASFSGFFYVRETDRHSGIRIQWNGSVVPGDVVSVTGNLATINGERCITAAEVRS